MLAYRKLRMEGRYISWTLYISHLTWHDLGHYNLVNSKALRGWLAILVNFKIIS
jgi:hypothetical protein